MKQRIRDKLENLADRLQELDRLLATSEAAADMDNYRKLTREHAEITPVVGLYRDFCRAVDDEASARELLADPEMKELAAAELDRASAFGLGRPAGGGDEQRCRQGQQRADRRPLDDDFRVPSRASK